MIIGEKPWRQAMSNPLQRVPFMNVTAKRVIHSATNSIKNAFATFGSSAGSWSRRFGSVLLAELVFILFLHFYMLIPIMFLVIPAITIDYIAFIGVIVYIRFMVRTFSQHNLKTISVFNGFRKSLERKIGQLVVTKSPN